MKCEICGDEALVSLNKCTNCWEVEERLKEYLKSDKGIMFVIRALEEIDTGTDWQMKVYRIRRKK